MVGSAHLRNLSGASVAPPEAFTPETSDFGFSEIQQPETYHGLVAQLFAPRSFR